jgi:hypothetical protein
VHFLCRYPASLKTWRSRGHHVTLRWCSRNFSTLIHRNLYGRDHVEKTWFYHVTKIHVNSGACATWNYHGHFMADQRGHCKFRTFAISCFLSFSLSGAWFRAFVVSKCRTFSLSHFRTFAMSWSAICEALCCSPCFIRTDDYLFRISSLILMKLGDLEGRMDKWISRVSWREIYWAKGRCQKRWDEF